VFVPNSFAIGRYTCDWESCALVPWAMHLPSNAGPRDIQALIIRELKLQPREVSVTLHQPEPYMILFEHMLHAAAARNKGRFTGRGLDICLRLWRSLSNALAFRIFYHARLCLDEILPHVWTPEIVERVIGHRCVLQYIVTDLVQPADTRRIELWTWMMDPSENPKKVWLAFTHRPSEGSSVAHVFTEPPPEPWHQGVRFEVFIHMPLLKDYTTAENNLQAAVDNPTGFQPVRCRYDWCYGLVDDAHSMARSCFPTRIPRPLRSGRVVTCATRLPRMSGMAKTVAARVLGAASVAAVTPDAAMTTGLAAANVGNATTKSGWKTTYIGLPG
jgi:hypothetical protein